MYQWLPVPCGIHISNAYSVVSGVPILLAKCFATLTLCIYLYSPTGSYCSNAAVIPCAAGFFGSTPGQTVSPLSKVTCVKYIVLQKLSLRDLSFCRVLPALVCVQPASGAVWAQRIVLRICATLRGSIARLVHLVCNLGERGWSLVAARVAVYCA